MRSYISLKTEYWIKGSIILAYLSPLIVAYFKEDNLHLPKIYYIGLLLSILAMVRFKEEVANNWIFALAFILFLINLLFISMYFFGMYFL